MADRRKLIKRAIVRAEAAVVAVENVTEPNPEVLTLAAQMFRDAARDLTAAANAAQGESR